MVDSFGMIQLQVINRKQYSLTWMGTNTLGITFDLKCIRRSDAIRFAYKVSVNCRSRMAIAIDKPDLLYIAIIADDKRFIRHINKSLHCRFG